MGGSRLTYAVVKQRLAEKGCIIQIDEDEFEEIKKENSNISAYKFTVIRQCCRSTTNTSVHEAKNIKHKKCIQCVYRDNALSYDDVVDIFTEKLCTLLTSKKDFEELYEKNRNTLYIPLTYKPQCCKNIRVSTIHNMRNGYADVWLCKNCTEDRHRIVKQVTARNHDGILATYALEYQSFQIFESNISDEFDIIRMGDGNLADCIIKPKKILDDLWLKIQLKSAQKHEIAKSYRFGINKINYVNMMIVCIGIDAHETLFWIFNHMEIQDKNLLCLTDRAASKYYNNFCKKISLLMRCHEFYNSELKVSSYTASVPKSITSQREHEFACLRKSKLNFINFIRPNLDNMPYDFIINGYKIQEKSYNAPCYRGFEFKLRKNGTNKQKIPYAKTDNDFYWFNLPDKRKFYVIPEQEMIYHKFVTTDTQEGKTSIVLFPDQKSWKSKHLSYFAIQYLFDYENPEKNKLLKLFNLYKNK